MFPCSENYGFFSGVKNMKSSKPREELPRSKPAFDQDPHRLRDISERNLEAAIGREVRNFRRQQGMTVADVANVTDRKSVV